MRTHLPMEQLLLLLSSKIKTHEQDLVELADLSDTIPSFASFVTPTSEHGHASSIISTNLMDRIMVVDSSDQGNLSDLSTALSQAALPQTNEFDFARHFKTPEDPSLDSGVGC